MARRARAAPSLCPGARACPGRVHHSSLARSAGAVFYLTEDARFIIKTVSKKESKFLRRMLPNYYAHVLSCDQTLLPHFYGLVRITTALGRNIRLVVMNNLRPEDLPVHEKFDLKGSTLGRYATVAEKRSTNVTLKDLDWRHRLAVPGTLQEPSRSLPGTF